MKPFEPKRVFFEENALAYPLGQKLFNTYSVQGIPIRKIGSHNRVTGIPGDNPQQSYSEAKKTLVVGVKRDLRLDTCKPSADYEFSLATSCPGGCQYCYLQTHLGKKPYVRIYVNIDEILARIEEITAARLPEITTFEAASTSDPLAVEHITGSLAKTITYFGELASARLRVVTKFDHVDALLSLAHQRHTKFRFSLNTSQVIQDFEQHTASLSERIAAADKMAQSGYPLGFIIAPLFMYPDYARDYQALFQTMAEQLRTDPSQISFELITHRFTKRAKSIILERFPGTKLDLDEAKRRRKTGRYGLIKYIYSQADYNQLKTTILELLDRYFPQSQIEYFT